jgi:hypothetical protein
MIYSFPVTNNSAFNRQNIRCFEVPNSHHSPKPTTSTTNSADITDLAHRSAVLGEVLRAVEGARHSGFAARVNGRVAGAADGELGESVELDVDGVCGLALGDGFEFAGL